MESLARHNLGWVRGRGALKQAAGQDFSGSQRDRSLGVTHSETRVPCAPHQLDGPWLELLGPTRNTVNLFHSGSEFERPIKVERFAQSAAADG